MKKKQFCPYCRHKLTEKIIEDRLRLYCTQCRSPIYENPIPATAAVYFNENHEVLLVRRKVDPKKGEWCLPGGFVELEETPEQCCVRELKEETNLNGEIRNLMGVYLSDSPVYKSVLVIGYLLNRVDGQIRAGDDSDEVDFFSLDHLPAIAFMSHRSLIRDAYGLFSKSKPGSAKRGDLLRFGAYVITSLDPIEMIRKACLAGARIIQYRDKTAGPKELLANSRRIREITREKNTLFIVNDYPDIALLSEADGVHLGQDDLPVHEVRRMTPSGFIVGVSTHSLEQALDAEKAGADYIAIGPVFATPTKEDSHPIGLKIVKKVIQAVSIPVVAIGGLNLENVSNLKKIGVKNVAMVRAFQGDTEITVKQLNKLLHPVCGQMPGSGNIRD